MQLISIQNIDKFLNCKIIAVAGASRKDKSFSATAITHLRGKGYTMLSINPNFIENSVARNEFKSVKNLPKGAKINLLVLTNPEQTLSVVKEAIEGGIKNIWVQQKSETPEVIALCSNKVNLIYNQCIFMFTQPEGIHKFHYRLKKFFGALPR